MEAIVLTEHGGPEVLQLQDHPDPQAPPGWELVTLRAAALNWHDCLLRAGTYDFPVPRIPGADGAGVSQRTGERVMVFPSLRWGSREDAPESGWSILGDLVDGTYAQQVVVPQENVVPAPTGWSFAEAAALPLASVTAYRALFTRGQLRSDETVLILGASGGVASIAISLARMAGARVFVTTSTEDKLERARALGALDGVLYTTDDWPDAVRSLTGREGVDLVVDSVGGVWDQPLSTLRPGGRLVSFGATGSVTTHIDVRRFYFAQQSILGTTMGSPRDFALFLELIATDPGWRPPIDRVLGLDRAAEAHMIMEQRQHRGKIILEIE